jgi:hypothetical protein
MMVERRLTYKFQTIAVVTVPISLLAIIADWFDLVTPYASRDASPASFRSRYADHDGTQVERRGAKVAEYSICYWHKACLSISS